MTGNDKVPRNPGVVPLRTILKNFLNLVESCEAGIGDGSSAYEKEFQELKQFSESLKTDPAYLCKEGEKPVNRKKNRYKDILPFDYTRVILGDFGDVPGSDYINANFIKGASGSSAYVACQGPLPHTVNDFWRMVVECEVQVIVMACNEQESGKHKCENYWVEEEGVEREFGRVKIWLKKCRQVCPDFLVRTMRISYTTANGETEERNVCQFHYSAWPDHGVPTKVRPLLDMVRLIRDCQTSETLPVLVHCSAGCGRTGTICAIDYVWGLLRLGKLTSDFSLFHLVREMRRQRIAMVQTKDQYIMVHRAVKELFEEQLKIIESHPYANVDQLGLPIDIKNDLEEHTYETVEYNPTPLDVAQYKPSTSIPPIPPPHTDLAGVSKLLKNEPEAEDNPGSSQQDERPSRWLKQPKIDDITVLSSDGEEVVEPPRHKKSGHFRNAILRKPSIVKIKSFFEKSKDGKKSGGTNLSRAKSDVSSSRFYPFNNIGASFPFHSKGSHSSKSPTPSLDTAASSNLPASSNLGSSKTLFPITATTNPSKECTPAKPPLFAKPLLPIKRSKSLKLGKEDSFEHLDKSNRRQPSGGMTDKAETSCALVSNISSYPIKLPIKQLVIPQMKKLLSTSVKPEIQTATTVELNKQTSSSSSSSCGSWQKTKTEGGVGGDDLLSSLTNKPLIPPKSQFLKETNQGSPASNNRIKMGVAKELEDVLDFGRHHSKYDQLKKYDTVTIINIPTNKRTSLSRSQSHVWQPTKVQMPFRIFSDENIHQSVVAPETKMDRHLLHQQPINLQNSALLSQSNDRVHERRTFDSFDDSCSKMSDGVIFTIGGSLSNSSHEQSSPAPDLEASNKNINSDDTKPMARRRVPKTNPYANYTPTGLGSSTLPYPQSPPTTMPSQPQGVKVASVVPSIPLAATSATTTSVENSRIPKDLPQLKPGYSRSRENSSDSSSNTATPRSSLPGTPTQTMDSTYAQIMRSNMQGLKTSNKGFTRNNGTAPQKSILKGSLSSTPSESDERLDTGRQASSPSHVAKPSLPSIITPPQKINTVRTVMGIRERRNSFRQAVCKDKEDQQQTGSKDEFFRDNFLTNNPRLFADGGVPQQKSGDRSTSSSGIVRAHKDYEPIWPSENGHYSNGGSSFAIVSDDSYINRAPLKPQTQQPKFSINGISYGSRPEPRGSISSNNGISRQQEMFGAQSSQRGHGEDKPLHNYPKQNSQPFQSRFDEIKLLLEELKAPNAVNQTQNKFSATSQNSTYFNEGPSSLLKEPTSSSNANPAVSLKYQRSLRTPSKPQYPPGLSCFTFKKPSSMESLTDSVHYDMMQPSTLNGDTTPLIKQNGFHVTSSSSMTSGGGQGRSSNDYVSLRQGHNYGPSRPSPPTSSIPRMELHNSHIGSNGIPIAPPRTRKLQKSNSASLEGSTTAPNAMDMTFSTSHLSDGRSSGSNNLPEVVRSSFQSSSNNTPSSSPKHITKAMGIFQAAANMRSKLSNWNREESKDKPNGGGSSSEKDDHDGGFMSSSLHQQNIPSSRPTSRHQYL